MTWLIAGVLAWLVGWGLNVWLSNQPKTRFTRLAVPIIFGVTLIAIWECVVQGFEINAVLLPPPSMIAALSLCT